MNLDAPRAKIDALVKAGIASRHPGTKVQYQNLKFTQPNGETWLSVTLTPGESDRADIGAHNPRFFHWGVAQINIMVPNEKGTKDHNDIATTLHDILADKNFAIEGGSLTLCNVKQRDRGVINGFAVRSFLVEYRYRAIRT